jgi:SAM-dependent methyltransferase
LTRQQTRVAIFWISLLGLYLELLLIRWLATEIRIFAYLQNTVLVVCFLGLGIGLFTSRRPISGQRGLFSLVILAAGLAFPQTREILSHTSSLLSVLGEMNIWEMGGRSSTPVAVAALAIGLTSTFLIIILVVEPFVPIGRLLGRLLDEDPRPILAYSVNVIGSLAGIWLFVALSRLSQPPTTWFVLLALLTLPFLLYRKTFDWLSLALLVCLPPLVFLSQRTDDVIKTVWSPYQKLELVEFGPAGVPLVPTVRYQLFVNNSGYQLILDLRSSGEGARTAGPVPGVTLSTYDVPALLHPDPDQVLVVGSGTGNDVAGLLRNGAQHVTAVDIDPVILEFGREYHPEKPYDSERVETVNADARSFFARTDRRYDVIAFGFLDSHVSTSLTNARLDHYVYTEESFTHVRDLLNEGGIVTVTFFPLRPFILDRIAVQLRDVFGEEPLVFSFPLDAHGSQGLLFIAGDLETARSRIATVPELARLNVLAEADPVDLPYTTVPSTDDWPYLYLENARIPLLFFLLAGLLALIIVYAGRAFDLPATMNPRLWDWGSWHFFFLGAAFLLLEVQNISKASVVLGNTWLVNAIIITGVLVMVLIANAVVIRRPEIPLAPVYGVLLGTVAALYLVDLARFAFLPFAWKAAIVGALTTLPMLFSGMAFARAFAVTDRKDFALGANLLGALVGGVLQSISFLLGIKALLLVVGIFYFAAALTRPGSERVKIAG